MSEIEKMKRYIERTKIPHGKARVYQMSMQEALALYNQVYTCEDLPIDIISLAFTYGQAKGYRAAKAEMKEAIT